MKSIILPPGSDTVTEEDRILVGMRELIGSEQPTHDYIPVREYVVTACTGSGSLLSVDVSPNNSSGLLPALMSLPVHPGLLAEDIEDIPAGTLVRVRFLNASPLRPVITAVVGSSGKTTIDAPLVVVGPSASVELAGGSAPVARSGDIVLVDLPAGPLPVAGLVNGTLPFDGAVTFVVPQVVGIIQNGNPRVTA